MLAAAFFAAPCAVAVQTAGIEWTLGRNATREGDIVVIDTQGKRNGGAAHAKLDLGGLTGGVRATIRARGRGIGRPDKSYFGLKFMFHYRDPASGAEKWPQADHKGGNFDWTTLELTTDLGPTPVGEVGITLGLQNVAGKVEFDVSVKEEKEEKRKKLLTKEELLAQLTIHNLREEAAKITAREEAKDAGH